SAGELFSKITVNGVDSQLNIGPISCNGNVTSSPGKEVPLTLNSFNLKVTGSTPAILSATTIILPVRLPVAVGKKFTGIVIFCDLLIAVFGVKPDLSKVKAGSDPASK